MPDNTEVIQGLLDKLGVTRAETERLQASVASVRARWTAERALADDLAEVLGQCADKLTAEDISTSMDTRAERERADEVLARWGNARREGHVP